MNQCTSHSFPDAADTSTCQDYSSIRLQSYFHDQFSKQRRKRDFCQQQEMEPIETVACKIRKRNYYMKTYMQSRRLSHQQQLTDRLLTKKCMTKLRQEPVRPEKERLMTKKSMRKARQVPERPKKERSMTKESMRKARQKPERPEKERLMTK
ncbi:hypothetical protein DPMN_069199 [Dreissena polymorpha]|uniref:Uncharacterized protein n=1 Tax=Dreissena polymorpha TaxID=45954 RepID=A0A9D3Z319_DREPO|nr:hypothetical protein DPMN_069199 [Dreissena polymorpha]